MSTDTKKNNEFQFLIYLVEIILGNISIFLGAEE